MTFLSWGDWPARQHSLTYGTRSSGPRFWHFLHKLEPISWIRTLATLGGVLSQVQNDVECVIAYCNRALRPSQRKYCTTKREILAAVSMCIQFRSYLRGAKFTIRTDHKSLVWLHRFKDTEGMMARWLHTLQQFQFSIIHRAGRDHGNADG